MRAACLGAAAAPAPAQSPGHPPLSVHSDTLLRLFTPTFLPGGPLIIHRIAHHVHCRRLLRDDETSPMSLCLHRLSVRSCRAAHCCAKCVNL
ncbi:hypothetical protein MTO96_016860 [Rhipicephalus appendiculatus]